MALGARVFPARLFLLAQGLSGIIWHEVSDGQKARLIFVER